MQEVNNVLLKTKWKYDFQVRMQMFVIGLEMCDFVVWTIKYIKSVRVPYDPAFMADVTAKLERFWVGQVVPLMMLFSDDNATKLSQGI